MQKSETKRIHLISGPRNISTALMYSFAQRKDTMVIDEPFYGYYLKHTGVDHPGREESMNAMSCDPKEVVDNVIFGDYPVGIVFFKDMAKHLIDLDLTFLNKLENVFLIRHPAKLISSFAMVIPDMNESDIGLKYEWELFNLLQNSGNNPIVIDSGEILKEPAIMMKRVCDELHIPFTEEMLHWQPGPRPEDGPWAKYWYQNVHKSDGLKKKIDMISYVPDHLRKLFEEVMPFYDRLFQCAIKL